MALQKIRPAQVTRLGDRARVLLTIAAAIAVMLALTAIFGVGQTGPTYDLVPDPAAAAGLPF